MTAMAERLRRGEERKRIFGNVCNGVPKNVIAVAFEMSIEEVERDIEFVAKKIREYRHRRCLQPNPDQGMLPPIACETEADILANRDALLWTLNFLGPETLSSELILPPIVTQKVEKLAHLKEAAHLVRARTRTMQ